MVWEDLQDSLASLVLVEHPAFHIQNACVLVKLPLAQLCHSQNNETTNQINRHKVKLKTNLWTYNVDVKIGRRHLWGVRRLWRGEKKNLKLEIKYKTKNREKKFTVLGIATMDTYQRVCNDFLSVHDLDHRWQRGCATVVAEWENGVFRFKVEVRTFNKLKIKLQWI